MLLCTDPYGLIHKYLHNVHKYTIHINISYFYLGILFVANRKGAMSKANITHYSCLAIMLVYPSFPAWPFITSDCYIAES